MRHPKSVRRELRSLATTAYERELDSALKDIYADFKKWKNKKIDSFELNQLIHEFHQNKSRELWNMYNEKDEDFIVTRAVRLGVLKPGEISAETAEAIHLDRGIEQVQGMRQKRGQMWVYEFPVLKAFELKGITKLQMCGASRIPNGGGKGENRNNTLMWE